MGLDRHVSLPNLYSLRQLSIQAESVSLSLQAPILIHPRAKPGCSKTVLSYFNGTLGQPTTLRGQLRSQATKLREKEEGDEDIVVSKWKDEIQGPILGPLVDKDGKVIDQEERRMGSEEEGKDHELGGRMRERQISGESHSESSSSMTPTATSTSPVTTTTTPSDDTVSPAISTDTMGEPKILVIGDRMFTDTLLANRLAKLLPTPRPSPTSAQSDPSPTTLITPTPSVLSIHTTLLLQPSDVRFLRWIEETLTRSRVREGPIDWARYTITIPTPILPPALSWKDKMNPFRDTPPLTWSPKTWRPKPLLAGTGAGLLFLGRKLGQGLYYLGGRIWEGEVEVAKAMAARAEVAQAERKVMQVKEGVATAVHDVGHKA